MLITVEYNITEQNEKVESLRYIYASYKNDTKIKLNNADDESRMNDYYEKLLKNIDLKVDNDNLLLVKCKLFMRFTKFIKNMNQNDQTNILLNYLQRKDIQHVPNNDEKHCELAIYDHLLLNDDIIQIDFKYIAISKLCCPLCYFILSRMGIQTRGCHKLLHY